MAKNARVIKSVNTNQHAIIRDILELHNGGNPIDCDITYSIGNFYGTFTEKVPTVDIFGNKMYEERTFKIDRPRICIDAFPQMDFVQKWEDPYGPLPLEDNSMKCIVCDPPFVVSPRYCRSSIDKKKGSNTIANRFSSYYPRYQMFESYENLIKESYRVLEPGGILIFKSQPTISGGLQLMTTMYMLNEAEKAGFYILDEFILVNNQRLLSGKIQKQQHARKYHSYFHVLQKDNPKKNKIGYYKRDYKHEEPPKEIEDVIIKSGM